MRRVLLAGSAVLLLVGSAVPSDASPPVRTGDWLLIVADGGRTGTPRGAAGASGTLTLSGRGPWVTGIGIPQGGVAVFTNVAGGPVDLQVTSPAGSVHHSVLQTTVPGTGTTSMGGAVPALGPHQRAYILFFDSNARLTLSRWFSTEGINVRFLVGTGTRVLRFVESGDTGTGVGAGPVAAGVLMARSERTRTGIAGGVAMPPQLFDGLPAAGTWHGPGGRQGSWMTAGPFVPVSPFAGPAGQWSWSWSGAAQGGGQPPALVAYAPIGEAWRAFQRPS